MKPIFTLEDGTQVLEATGDASAFEYGGGVLYRTGKSCWWDFWDSPDKNYFIYRADASRDVLGRYDVDLEELSLASAGEIGTKDLLKLSAHANPRARLRALMLIRDSYGASMLDPDGPTEMTKFELAKRWGFLFGIAKETIAEISLEDYIIRENNERWESGRVDGYFLGRFKRYDHALAAVADNMKEVGLFTNLFHEHSVGDIELVQWDPEEHIGRRPRLRGKMPASQWKVAMRRYAAGRRIRKKKPRTITSIRRSEALRVSQKLRIEKARKIREFLQG